MRSLTTEDKALSPPREPRSPTRGTLSPKRAASGAIGRSKTESAPSSKTPAKGALSPPPKEMASRGHRELTSPPKVALSSQADTKEAEETEVLTLQSQVDASRIRKTAEKGGLKDPSKRLHVAPPISVGTYVGQNKAEAKTPEHPRRNSLDPDMRPPLSESPDFQASKRVGTKPSGPEMDVPFPSDSERLLQKSALIDSLQELEWVTEEAREQAFAAFRLAAEWNAEICQRKEELRELELQVAQAKQRVAATTPIQDESLPVAKMGTGTGEKGGDIEGKGAETGRGVNEREKIGRATGGKEDKAGRKDGIARDESEVTGEKEDDIRDTKEDGSESGNETVKTGIQVAEKAFSKGSEGKVTREMGTDAPTPFEVQELEIAALQLQVLANRGDLLVAKQKIPGEMAGASGLEDTEAALLETLDEIKAAQSRMPADVTRTSGRFEAGRQLGGEDAEVAAVAKVDPAVAAMGTATDTRVADLESEVARMKVASEADAKEAAKQGQIIGDLKKKVQTLMVEKLALSTELDGTIQVYEETLARRNEAEESRVAHVIELMNEQVEFHRSELEQVHNRLVTALDENAKLERELREAQLKQDKKMSKFWRGPAWEEGSGSAQ
ncbi:hypothetical protein KFL_001750060 [Klebsormidium nitens]|uniref:Uncharacterized protein n=1 Tax=Klebsormidium nitens TaxID=105231 RepID=A0A1Y1I3T2_KLENI|nr:hypothetical protein KFL_001750060 [Klebsormidium nitens]|eukprot:GAQ84069.1 hypothetical protein KFL_001750060 [Klebsormidium nitens]